VIDLNNLRLPKKSPFVGWKNIKEAGYT
jgi:hypothetical protein